MIRKTLPILAAGLLGCVASMESPDVSPQTLQLSEGMESSFHTEEATVVKVFSAQDGENRFVAYLVNWRNQEVVVGDPLARSRFTVGDTIRFFVQKFTSERSPIPVAALDFSLIEHGNPECEDPETDPDAPAPAEQKRLMKLIEGDLDAAENEAERFLALTRAARNALQAGEREQARKLASELAGMAPKYKGDWNYGNAVQDANQVLGSLALGDGDLAEAKARLLASADSDGSPQMNSFGPNMRLARDLLARGEKEAVLEYFERCRKFWALGAGKLDAWRDTVTAGKMPDFGANLLY